MISPSVNTSLEVIGVIPRGKGGRPTSLTKDVSDQICERLAEGEPLAQICRDPDMPHYSTAKRWQRENREFRALSASAREDGTHYLAEETQMLSDAPLPRDPEAARIELMQRKLQIDTRMRLIGKWNSKAYGDKVQVDVVESKAQLAPEELPGGIGFLARAKLEAGGK